MEQLLYNQRAMRFEPIKGSVRELASALLGENAVVAELEPGDAGYYALLIVPCWTPHVKESLGRFGIPSDHAHKYLMVTKLDDRGGQTFYAAQHVGAWDLEQHMPNAWSREFISWWVRGLWLEIERQSA